MLPKTVPLHAMWPGKLKEWPPIVYTIGFKGEDI